MNAISRLSELLVPHSVRDVYRADTPLFLATPAHMLLASDVAAAIPHAGAPLAAREVPSADAYADAVAQAVARIRAGELDKVVLARTLEATGGATLGV
ncbi:hypothetical protein ACPUER_13475 [Burkholderia sp. DN3021]|uniref:hypothetical protein n=1 Tax=Burkholderia sp. DN3021 TaxID=3410137 RepID=UPI003C7B1A24